MKFCKACFSFWEELIFFLQLSNKLRYIKNNNSLVSFNSFYFLTQTTYKNLLQHFFWIFKTHLGIYYHVPFWIFYICVYTCVKHLLEQIFYRIIQSSLHFWASLIIVLISMFFWNKSSLQTTSLHSTSVLSKLLGTYDRVSHIELHKSRRL